MWNSAVPCVHKGMFAHCMLYKLVDRLDAGSLTMYWYTVDLVGCPFVLALTYVVSRFVCMPLHDYVFSCCRCVCISLPVSEKVTYGLKIRVCVCLVLCV